MAKTKRQLLNLALAKIGVSANVYSISGAKYAEMAAVMDSLVAEWESVHGVNIGYLFSGNPEDALLNSPMDIPAAAEPALVAGAALRIAPMFGKQILGPIMGEAAIAFKSIKPSIGAVKVTARPGVPMGAWQSAIFGRSFTQPVDNSGIGLNNGNLVFGASS